MDHHCDFLGVCIGKRNRKTFVALICTIWLTSALFILLTVCSCATNTDYMNDNLPAFTVKVVYDFLSVDYLLIFQAVVSGIVAWYSFWYAFLELYAITDGLTVNEVMNRHRYRHLFTAFRSMNGTPQLMYKNPFSRGITKNWLEFLAS